MATCRPQNARSWTALLSIRTPIRAIAAHCKRKKPRSDGTQMKCGREGKRAAFQNRVQKCDARQIANLEAFNRVRDAAT